MDEFQENSLPVNDPIVSENYKQINIVDRGSVQIHQLNEIQKFKDGPGQKDMVLNNMFRPLSSAEMAVH